MNGDVYAGAEDAPNIVGVTGAIVSIAGTVNGGAFGEPHAFEIAVDGNRVVRGDLSGSRMNNLLQSGTVLGSVRAHDMTLAPFDQGSVQVNTGNARKDVTITTTDSVIFFGSHVNGSATITDSKTVLVGNNAINGGLDSETNLSVSALGPPSIVRGGTSDQCANL